MPARHGEAQVEDDPQGDCESEYTDSSQTISEASSTWQFDERVTSGVRKLSFIEFKRTVDNVAIRPLFRDRELAREMLAFELHIGNRPMRIDEHSGEFDGIASERVPVTNEPLTPLGEALDECIERCRQRRRRNHAVPLAKAAQRGDCAGVRAHLQAARERRQADEADQGDGQAMPSTPPDTFENEGKGEETQARSPCKDRARRDGLRASATKEADCGVLVVADNPEDGLPGLLWSAMLDHRLVARLLLEGRVDPNTEDAKGWTAIMWSAHQNNAAIMQLLINHGADPNHRNRYGSTALTWAAEQGNAHAVRLLVSCGVDIEQATREGNTALLQASGAGHGDIVEFCLARGADVNAKNEALQTPLVRAAEAGHARVVRRLLQEGRRVDLEAQDQFSQTALSLARLWNSPTHVEMVALLECSIAERHRVLEEERRLLASQESEQRRRRGRRGRKKKT